MQLRIVVIAALLLTTACGEKKPPDVSCKTNAHLPNPPAVSKRSIPIIINWANTAVSVANLAISERDECATSLRTLRDFYNSK